MSISKNIKRSLLSAIAGTMMITSVVTPVEAQESLSTITSNTETSSSTTTQQSSSKSTSSSTQRSSSEKSATSSQKEEPLVAEGAELPEGQQYETATVDEGVVITGLGTVKITNGELIIPAEIDGKKVVEIDDKAFQNKSIEKITFEDGVTLLKIGDSAFQGNDITGDLSIEVETIGNNAFAQNDIQSVELHGIKQVGQDAFRDNKIDSIEFLPNLDETVEINDRAFINNRLTDEIDLTHAGEVGDEAFSTNKIRTVQVGDDTVLRDKVFANNGAWVEVKTSSGADSSRGIETKSYDDKTGQVIDPVSIIVRYLDQNGNSIAPEQRVGDDLVNDTQAFEKGKEATFTPRKIQNYRLDTPEIVFTPDSDGYVIEAKYTYVDQRPVIEIDRDGIELANGEKPSREKLMQGVTAKDKDGNDITSDVKIDTSNINIDAPGVYDVIYTVVDKNGNERIEKSSVTVGINWAEYEFGGGWQIKDFTFSRNSVTGFSESGEAKVAAGKKDLWIPPVNTSGKKVTGIASQAFRYKGIEKISSWGNAKYINTRAFSGNQLTSLPDSWGNVTSIGDEAFNNNQITRLPDDWGEVIRIENRAFWNNQITSLPDSWGNVTSIGDEAFFRNQITNLPDDWGEVRGIGFNTFSRNQITNLPDDWGWVTSIGEYAFYKNQITSIPGNSWGWVTKIGDSAFSDNQITSLPDSWGNVTSIGAEAFNNNQITSLPDDWGKVTSIGNSAFSNNQITSLPDDWGKVTSIGNSAFNNNQITSLPDDWGKVTSISDSAFRNNQITSLPDDWGEVTSIGYSAFSNNQITSLPDDWGKVTSIGGSAFFRNQLTRLPDDWGRVKSIGWNAFENNQLTSLPDSWGNVTSIGNSAFENNQLTSLPDSWGEVTNIGNRAFQNNQLTSIPNDWGNLTRINHLVFSNNQLASIPEDWGEVTSISDGAFRNNQITRLPDDWGKVTSISYDAFSNNQLTPGASFTILPENLTDNFLDDIYMSDIPTPISIITTDRSNPNNVKSTKDIRINLMEVTYRYVDEEGNEIAPSSSEIRQSDEKVTFTSPYLGHLGYQPVKAETTFTAARKDTQIVDIVYSKIDANQDTETNISLELNNDNPYKIGSDMTGYINVDRTGYSTDPLVNPRVYLTVDSRLYDIDSFNISSNSLGIRSSSYRREGNSFSFVLPHLNPAQSVKIPFRVKFNENVTPSHTDHPVTATITTSDGKVVRISESQTFSGYYDQPYQKIRANGEKMNGLIEDYEQTVVSNSGENPSSYVADDREGENVRNTITYSIANTDMHRNVGDYTTVVTLPSYEVHESSSLYSDENPTRLAKFDPEKNPGWVLSEDGKTVSYKGNNGGSNSRFSDTIVLGYPGAKEGKRIPVSSKTTLVPENYPQGKDEPVMITRDTITNHFARYSPPPGEIIVKYPTGNHGSRYNNYFYDNAVERNGEFPWIIPFNATHTFDDAVFKDFDLDDRMYYNTVTVPKSLGDVEVKVVDDRDATLQSFTIKGNEDRTVTFEKNRVLNGAQMHITLIDHPLQKGISDVIDLTSKLKDPDKQIYGDESQSVIFGNRALLSTKQGEFGPVYAQKTIKESVNEIAAFKTQQGFNSEGKRVDQIITDDSIRYTVGFTPREGMGETITNIKQVDILPIDIDVENVIMSQAFSALPGAKYEVVENYNNTGQTAVVFTASSATVEQLRPGYRFEVGDISVRTNMIIKDGRIDNDVYIHADNTKHANMVVDPPAGPGEWSHANVWTNYTAASGMSARKQIRTYDDNDKAMPWTSSVTTLPGAKLDYKLRLDNGTEDERENLVIYDVLPHVGDVGIPNERESAFENTYDPERQPVIPDGYTIKYYNGDSWPKYPSGVEAQSEANRVLEGLKWEDTPTKDTKAVKIIQNEGVKVPSRSRVEFTLPMRANAERLDEFGNPPADLVGPSAYNTFFWKDNKQSYLIEGNRVENKLKKHPIDITLRKVAKDTEKTLSGASFELRSLDGVVVSSAISDDNGIVRFVNVDVKPRYTIHEVSAPRGYVISNEVITLTKSQIAEGFKKNPAVIEVGDFENTPTPPAPKYGEVEFTKVDIDGNTLPGTKFQLRKYSPYTTYEATANKDGKVIFAGITPGTYTLEETQSIGRLQPMNDINNIRVEGDKTTYLGTTVNGVEHAVVNDKVKIPFTKLGVNDDRIYNQDGTPKPFGTYQGTDGSKLSSATFEVIDDETGIVVSTVSSSSWKDTYIENLTPGKVYRLNETQVPYNYEKIDGLDLRFKVDARGTLLHVDGTPMEIQNGFYVPNRNKTQESTVTVLKVDQDKNPVANAEFALQRKENDKWVQVGDTKTSGEDGVVSWRTNDSARYRIVETQTPAGYTGKYVSKEFLTQRTKSKTFSYTAVNDRIRPEVAKVEFIAQNLPTREAAVEVRDQNKNSVIEQRNNNWNVVRYLEGAVIEVRENDAQGALIQTITTDSNGKAQITADIDPDKNYVLVETQAPEGYELRTQPLTFNATTRLATDPAAKNGEFTVFVPNYKKNGRIVVSKLNESTGEPLTGGQATFEAFRVDTVDGQPQDDDIEIDGVFYRPNGRTITQKTSSSAGVASFNNLDYGTYIVRETASPDGYILDTAPALFVVDENNASHTFVFNNTPADPKIDITKYINGHDANSDLTAVWLDNDAETMDVKTVAENTGNTKLEKVTITDVIRDTDDQYINEALKTAMFTIRDSDGNLISENVANGEITLNPGDTVETTVNVASPEKGDMHRDDATVVGYYGDIEVTDEDPAHAYRIPDVVDFILPATGAVPRFGIIALLVMVLLGIAGSMAVRRRNTM